jgi:hypothetical protein
MVVRTVGLAILGTVAIVFTACGDHDSANPTPPDTTSPAAVAERFFHWYASERNLGHDPFAPGGIDANADVTTEFRQKLKAAAAASQPGVDPMLCSPSIPHAFNTGEATVSGSTASVTVAAESHGMTWRVDLTREGSVWQINTTTCTGG